MIAPYFSSEPDSLLRYKNTALSSLNFQLWIFFSIMRTDQKSYPKQVKWRRSKFYYLSSGQSRFIHKTLYQSKS